jgi:GTP-binding protein Era
MTDKPPIAPSASQPQRCGFIAVIGAPNAGKSTLVNALVGTKVTIVSHKVQTTRVPIRGIVMTGMSQLVFIDTPGIFKPKRRLDRAMVEAAWGGTGDADAIVFLFDVQAPIDTATKQIVERLAPAKGKRILALNKIDLVKKERLLEITETFNALLPFDATFMISALKGSGVEKLKAYLGSIVPEGPWHYDPDDVTDAPLRRLAAEITREKIYNRLHDELPYAATVETTDWKDLGKKGVRIEQTIFVERDSQRSIVLGKDGRTIKQISIEARTELTDIVEKPVHLFLFVKVKDGWENDPERYREMGLDFPTE